MGIYTQFAKKFSSVEEMEEAKIKLNEKVQKLNNVIPAETVPEDSLTPVITPEEATVKNFSTIRQGSSTNALTKIKATEGKTASIDDVTGEATITSGNFIIKIPNYAQLKGLNTSTYQLLDAITISLTESGAKEPTVVFTVDDYMERRGLKDRKEARKQLTADLDVLLKTSISWTEKRGKTELPYAGVNITDSWIWADKKKTAIAYTFGQTFYNVLLGYPVMPYPAQLQRLNSNKNPNSYYLLRKITEHKNMNVGKENEDIIAVQTLLAVAPFIPKYKEVMDTDRALNKRIIKPFERDLDVLENTLKWEYCHSKGNPLTDEELDNFNYDIFKDLLIHIYWNEYPDQTARLQRKEERQAEKKKATKKKKS